MTDYRTLSGQTLAYYGDAVYEVRIRKHLIDQGIVKPQVLQRIATHYVSAKAQAELIELMLDQTMLSEEEVLIYKRGRNAKTYTKAKNTNIKTYQKSTGFEALLGFLSLKGESDRVTELIDWCIAYVDKERAEKNGK
ncbi:MAG: ribonuclease III domain-containing protein [Lactobacillus sp.]|nr:ribonuclease III domain-containing protein [Lactobacillus sp.]